MERSQETSCSVPTLAALPDEPITINSLPPEILSEIFKAIMFWEDESDLVDPELEAMIPVFLPNPRAAPLLFCQVCSFWREVAISTPPLWSYIAINTSYRLETIATWLSRSLTHPLSFRIQLGASSKSLGKPEVLQQLILRLLSVGVERWEHICISVPPVFKAPILSLIRTVFPSKGDSPAVRLKTLYIACIPSADLRLRESLDNIFASPQHTLRRLVWDDRFVQPTHAVRTPLWVNLQHLIFVSTTTGTLLSLLAQCPNLHFLTIDAFRSERAADLTHSVIVAPKLQVLTITQISGDLTSSLSLLSAPQLKKLSLFEIGSRRSGPCEGFKSFLERSGCRLEVLCVGYQSCSLWEEEAYNLVSSPVFIDIPNFSLRMHVGYHPPAFLQFIRSFSKEDSYVWYEPWGSSIHAGWGSLNYIRTLDSAYPFLVRDPSRVKMLRLALRKGYQDKMMIN
ncbi:hypothetical protein BJ165DRAFT_1609970 [Panaeolus papilionaceus]|nr:hypothetical protein BJ165DRAFT_1609970 [Panaeolus papilionaceus]